MKFFCLLLLFPWLFVQESTAQQNRFLYLQTENSQPFYVRLNNIVYSSSNSGYVIIPKLKDGRYEFTVGFPGNKWPVQHLAYTIDKKDAGFILKNFGDKGWGLFHLQTLDVIMANAGTEKKETGIPEDDSFAGTLSQVVGADLSSPVTVEKNEPAKESTASIAEKKDEPIELGEIKITEVKVSTAAVEGKSATDATNAGSTETINTNSSAAGIERILSNTSAEGTDLVYVDRSAGKADTIRIFIPSPKAEEAAITQQKEGVIPEQPAASQPVAKKEVAAEQKGSTKKKKEKIKEPAFIEMELPADTASQQVASSAQTEPAKTTLVIPNSNCRANADDRDFLKLRKNMAAKRNAESMIAAARKDFRNRCYSVEQVKHLSALFLEDANKYMFFDAAYPSVHDFSNFPSLVSELKDPYYITRFEAMIRK